MRRGRFTELAIVATTVLAAAVFFTWPLALFISERLPAPGDSLPNAWVLAWVAERTSHGLFGVWNPPIFYPYTNALAFSEPLLGIAVPLAPVYWLTGNPVFFHNVAVLLAFVVTGTGGYVLGHRLTGSRSGGAVCAAAAAFMPGRALHLSHVQVLMVGWLWWLAWAVHCYFSGPTLGRALLAVTFLLLLSLSSLYWIYVGGIASAVIAFVEAWRRRGPVRAWLRHGAIAAGFVGAVLAPVAQHVRALTAEKSPVGSTVDAVSYGADGLAYVSGQPSLGLWRSFLREGRGESDLFPGALVLIGSGIALVVWRRASRLSGPSAVWIGPYAAMIPIGVFLSFGPAPTLAGRPWFDNTAFTSVASIVPGLAQMRAPARLGLLAHLGMSVLAAYSVAVVGAMVRRRATPAIGAGVCLLVLVEGLSLPVPLIPLSLYQRPGDKEAYGWLARQPAGAVVELPLDGWGTTHYSMLFQYRVLSHRHPYVSGVARYTPPLPAMLSDPDSALSAVDRVPEAVAFLQGLGVRWVVLHPAWFGDRSLGEGLRAAYSQAGRVVVPFGETTIVDLGAVPVVSADDAVDELPPGNMRVLASEGDVSRMLDGDPSTRWLTVPPQRAGAAIDVRVDREQSFVGVRMQLAGGTLNDYPRGLTVSVSRDGRSFTTVFDGSVFPALGAALRAVPQAPAINIRWPPTPGTHVRLVQTGRTTRDWSWTIHELRLLVPRR